MEGEERRKQRTSELQPSVDLHTEWPCGLVSACSTRMRVSMIFARESSGIGKRTVAQNRRYLAAFVHASYLCAENDQSMYAVPTALLPRLVHLFHPFPQSRRRRKRPLVHHREPDSRRTSLAGSSRPLCQQLGECAVFPTSLSTNSTAVSGETNITSSSPGTDARRTPLQYTAAVHRAQQEKRNERCSTPSGSKGGAGVVGEAMEGRRRTIRRCAAEERFIRE